MNKLVALAILGFAAGASMAFAILACGRNSVWCVVCAILWLLIGILVGDEK